MWKFDSSQARQNNLPKMKFIADFHIHSKYSRATSKNMEIPVLSKTAKVKGIHLLGTGDFTHPAWLEHLKENLVPAAEGLYKHDTTHFILTTEVNNIFYRQGRAKKIHNIIFAPDFEVVEKINAELASYGKLTADGRPTLHLEASQLVEIVLNISSDCFVVPAHAWTPWFSLFGANSGFDRLEDCFGNYTNQIYALETGLSSDPAMNWRLSDLDNYSLISNSDAHSPSKIGREANVFDCQLEYKEIIDVLREKDKNKFLFTIEFFPQEGKYHYDGHRNCGVVLSPEEAKENNNICPACRRKLTIGVMHRIERLGDRGPGFIPPKAVGFKNLIPLEEIISEAVGKQVGTEAVTREYERLIQEWENEFNILLDIPEEELLKISPSSIGEGIIRARRGEVNFKPGYDGVYGEIKIFEEERKETAQLNLFENI